MTTRQVKWTIFATIAGISAALILATGSWVWAIWMGFAFLLITEAKDPRTSSIITDVHTLAAIMDKHKAAGESQLKVIQSLSADILKLAGAMQALNERVTKEIVGVRSDLAASSRPPSKKKAKK